MSAILLNAPALEPVTLADAKLFLRIEHDDDDDVIAALIAAARVHVEAKTRRALITQTWRLTRDVWPAAGVLPILPVPLREVSAVGIYRDDGMLQMLDVDAFQIDTVAAPAMLMFERGALPAPGRMSGGIEIDIAVGYGDEPDDVPAPLRQAIQLLVAHWYENRRIIAASGEVASMPVSVTSLIAPFRVLSL
jgi:uncharacterized phiE125 gp8 family phage protein